MEYRVSCSSTRGEEGKRRAQLQQPATRKFFSLLGGGGVVEFFRSETNATPLLDCLPCGPKQSTTGR